MFDDDLGLVIVGGVEGDPVLPDSTLETTADGVHFSALTNVPIRIDAYKMSTKLSHFFPLLAKYRNQLMLFLFL